MAPIDIVINIINRHKQEEENKGSTRNEYINGKIDAYKSLIEELECFKKLFN